MGGCSASKSLVSSIETSSYCSVDSTAKRFTFSTFPGAGGVGRIKNPAGQEIHTALGPERRARVTILLL